MNRWQDKRPLDGQLVTVLMPGGVLTDGVYYENGVDGIFVFEFDGSEETMEVEEYPETTWKPTE